MVHAQELHSIPLFAGLTWDEKHRLASKAADLRLRAGEWLVQEGDATGFFVVLDGQIRLSRQISGTRKNLFLYKAGDFFGEGPVLLGTPSVASAQAETACRVARFEHQQLLELIRESSASSATILASMDNHVRRAQQFAQIAPSVRMIITGPAHDRRCYDIRAFLSANRILYEWKERSSDGAEPHGIHVVLDGEDLPQIATVRDLAEALGLQTAPREKNYDLVIIGAGPAGMAAAVYGASEGLKVLIVERSGIGGQAGTSSRIENYLGFPAGISGNDLAQRAWKQASRFGAEIAMTRRVTNLQKRDDRFWLELDEDQSVSAKAVLVATGVEWRLLDATGVDELLGRGVFYGFSRSEAFSVRGKRVCLVGGGNSAGQAAVFFSSYAEEVQLLVRGTDLESSMSHYLIGQLAAKDNITVELNTRVVDVSGDGRLQTLKTLRKGPDGDKPLSTRQADALFILIGGEAKTGWLPNTLDRDPRGFICTGRDVTRWALDRPAFALESSLPGLFCAGDVRHNSVKRVASGVGEGSMAVSFIHEYLATLR